MLPSFLGLAVRSSRATFHKRTLHFHPRLPGEWPPPTLTLRCKAGTRRHGIQTRACVVPRGFPNSLASTYTHTHTHTQIRGKRTRTVVSLDDLPQGLVRVDSEPQTGSSADEHEGPAAPSYPTVVLQARRNMQRFDNCVLLTRVGGFYELYFEHADEYGPLLNLKVAQKKTAAGPVPMVIPSPPMPYPPSRFSLSPVPALPGQTSYVSARAWHHLLGF
jgi:hypothetical protein